MQWKYEAINDLRELNHRRAAILLLQREIATLEEYTHTAEAGDPNIMFGEPANGDYHEADLYMDAQTKLNRLRINLDITQRHVDALTDALHGLPDDQREILELSFCDRHTIDEIGDRYNVERSQVYRLRDKALRALTLRLYGLTDA